MAIDFDYSLYYGKQMEDLPVVTNPKIGTTANEELTIPEDGLFSESIFGPLKNYSCKCGHKKTTSSKGQRCPICNVLCDTKNLRNETFAKIELPFNMFLIQPFLIVNLLKIFGKEAIKNIMNVKNYEKNKKNPYLFSFNQRKLVKVSKLKKRDLVIELIVYDITSLHKLWRYFLKTPKLYEEYILPVSPHDIINKITFINHIPVTPPNSRPIIRLSKDKWNVSEISTIYSNLLKNIGNSQSISDDLYSTNEYLWGSSVYKYQYLLNQLHQLKDEKTFEGKESIFRDSLSGKTIEFSSRQIIVPNPAVKPYGLGICEKSIKDFYIFNIIHFIDKKYNKNNDNSNMMNFIQEINRDMKLGKTINFKDEDFFEFLLNGGLNEERVIMERPPVLYKLNTSGLLIDSVILESNLQRDIEILVDENDYKTVKVKKKARNLLMEKMNGNNEFNHNKFIVLPNTKKVEDSIDLTSDIN